jgi:antitoxin component HigA of HigAB toxin-antitoxin module
MKNLIRSLLVAPIALWIAAPANADLAPSAPRPAAEVQVAEASTSPAEHKTYAQQARDGLDVWRGKLNDFGASAKADAKGTRQAATEDLNKAWVKANEALARLEVASTADWESAKTAFGKASDELATSWTKARADVK